MKKCSDVMTKDPACCLPGEGVVEAAKLMKREDVGSVPVVESRLTKKLLGIVTDRDLALKVVAERRGVRNVKVEEVMTRELVTCRADDDLQTALNAMAQHQVRRLPVVGSNGQIVGIIAQADVATRTEAPQNTARVVEEISKAGAAGAQR